MIDNMLNSLFRHILFCAVIAALLVRGDFPTGETAECAEVVDRIVAVVNDDIITLNELDRAFKPYEMKIKLQGYPPGEEMKALFNMRERKLNDLIDEKLTDQEIAKANISVSESDVDESIERIKRNNYFTDEDIRRALTTQGITMEEYRAKIRNRMLRSKLVNYKIKSKIVITKEDIESYYNSHRELYEGKTRYHLRNIIMKIPPLADDEDMLKIKEKMEGILVELGEGASFQDLAREYSESPFADDGGDLGLFDLDDLSLQIRDAVEHIGEGGFSPVINTRQGYQIFYVDEIAREEGRSLEAASPEIEDKLYNEVMEERFRTWIEQLRKQAHIKIIQ